MYPKRPKMLRPTATSKTTWRIHFFNSMVLTSSVNLLMIPSLLTVYSISNLVPHSSVIYGSTFVILSWLPLPSHSNIGITITVLAVVVVEVLVLLWCCDIDSTEENPFLHLIPWGVAMNFMKTSLKRHTEELRHVQLTNNPKWYYTVSHFPF